MGKISQRERISLLAIALFALIASACSAGTSTVTVTTGGASSSTTGTPIPTATATQPSCATLLPGASPLGSIAHFAEVVLPSGTNPVATAPQTSGGGTGQFTITAYNVCFTGTSDEVVGPFSAHHSLSANLLGTGWGLTPASFPFDGQYNKPCSSGQTCFFSGVSVIGRQLEVDSVTDHGSQLITFHLVLAFPPPAPSCSNFSSSPYQGIQTTASTAYGSVPLPPISRVIPNNYTGHGGLSVCSAGTVATIGTFLKTYMPLSGWSLQSSSSSQQSWKSAKGCVLMGITDPTFWDITWTNPAFNMPC